MEANLKRNLRSKGQTLIETLAAVFILAMGITASTGLAIYALNSSSGVVKQIIATGLAREALEAVRNMRDTNWLQDSLVVNGCYDFSSTPIGQQTANCYQNWLGKNGAGGPPFCFNPSPGNSCNGGDVSDAYYLGFDYAVSNPDFWVLKKDNGNFYGLNLDTNNSGTTGFYSPGNGVTCINSNSGYCRKIVITNYSKNHSNAVSPYNVDDTLSLVKVQSQVWWVDKKCPKVSDFDIASPTCKLEMDTYLTNWKNY